MHKLLAAVKKELTLLRRDMAGLVVLFVMPVVLVIIVTLVQENVSKTFGDSAIKVLLIDNDKKFVGRSVEREFRKSPLLSIVKNDDKAVADAAAIQSMVVKGLYQICILIPEGATAELQKRVDASVRESFSGKSRKNDLQKTPVRRKSLTVYSDPALRESMRSSVINLLEKILLSAELEEKFTVFARIYPEEVIKHIKKEAGPYWTKETESKFPKATMQFSHDAYLAVDQKTASGPSAQALPTSLQQNIPAWTLFGMFFIVVPLGGSLIRERQNGTLSRLVAMPVSPVVVLSGKIMAYVVICSMQLFLILIVGKTLLPILGTSSLQMGSSFWGIILVALSSALAACGYGILIGTLSRTYEQASMFGAVSVVIAAAIGGIMVPVYAMPKVLQAVSIFSPLSWGLNGFLTLFVRGGSIEGVLRDVGLLVAFFLVTITIAWSVMFHREGIRT